MVLCIVKFPAVVSVVWRIFARFRGTVSIDSADCKNAFSVLFGSVLEHLAVNRSVVGSSPTGGAHKARKFNVYGFYLFPRATSQADMLACPFCGCREPAARKQNWDQKYSTTPICISKKGFGCLH